MQRILASVAVSAVALAAPEAARSDVGVVALTKVVPVGGVLYGRGDGSGMPLYLVRAAEGAQRTPFVYLGRLRRTTDPHVKPEFSFELPSRVEPGLYRLSLGRTIAAATVRVTARASPRTIQVDREHDRKRFLVSQPEGVILLFRVTVPRGTPLVLTATIPGVAGARISTRWPGVCRRRGAVDVCTQSMEWCPMPAAVWRVQLQKYGGAAGTIRLDFVVAKPPRHARAAASVRSPKS